MVTKIGRDIALAKDLLMNGELVAVPTETVYGLAGVINSDKAIREIFQVKSRPSYDPLIVHASNLETLKSTLIGSPSKELDLLAEEFWPGPLTIVVKKKESVSGLITAGLDTVAIRIPNHPLLIELLEELETPIAAPSANPFGYVSPSTPQHVWDQLAGEIGYILDGGDCQVGLESTILDLSKEEPKILRKGKILPEDIGKVISKKVEYSKDKDPAVAPGNFGKHYSPNTPVKVFGEGKMEIEDPDSKNIAYIFFNKKTDDLLPDQQMVLSEEGNLEEAARNLYKALRKFDSAEYTQIQIELAPEKGLGMAINDRIIRTTKSL